MPERDDNAAEQENLRQAIARLETQQQVFGLDFTAQLAELQRRLGNTGSVSQSGSGAGVMHGGVAAGARGIAAGGDVNSQLIVMGGSPHIALSAPSVTGLGADYHVIEA